MGVAKFYITLDYKMTLIKKDVKHLKNRNKNKSKMPKVQYLKLFLWLKQLQLMFQVKFFLKKIIQKTTKRFNKKCWDNNAKNANILEMISNYINNICALL